MAARTLRFCHRPRQQDQLPSLPSAQFEISPSEHAATASTSVSVRRLFLGDDITPAVEMLAVCFSADPLLRYVYNASPLEEITIRNKALFRAVLSHHLSRRDGHAVVHASSCGKVVAVWQEAGAWKTGYAQWLKLMPAMLRTFGVGTRARAIVRKLESQHPEGRNHVHLQFLGRFGSQLLHADATAEEDAVIGLMLDRLDVSRLPAYVEVAKDEDVGFYERHGFAVVGELDMPEDAPRVVGMWREPKM